MKKFWKEFKEFISRGSVIDMAVGIIIGSAFTAIVTAVTNKIIMPIINWLLLLITGGNGLDSVFTYLKKVEDINGVVDLEKSIYIDWGALITAILNFIIIAFILFSMLKAFNAARNGFEKTRREFPTRAERKELKTRGVNMKNAKEVIAKTAELRAEKKAEAEAKAKSEADANKKPTTEELLAEILVELKKNNHQDENKEKTE